MKTPTSQHAEHYGLCVLSQQIRLDDGGQREIAGHVPAQLPVSSLQEAHSHRDGQCHDGWTAVVLMEIIPRCQIQAAKQPSQTRKHKRKH